VNTNSKSHSFVLDVDGVLTTGQFFYSEHGKSYKVFGPHDNDGLKILKNRVEIQFITADSKGFEISRKRIVDDMGFSLTLVSENDRYEFVKKKYGLSKLFYMGDGIHDARLIKDCLFGVAPKNARIEAKKAANFVTNSNSAEGAVLDACLEINKIFFNG
jgi:3-deoxy-D-manno-octulosonate 8-phosphate phosphatase (KDO 8-P phosphatase)